MSAGMKLKALRGKETQQKVASDLGITKSALAMYERDKRVPRDEIKVRIAHYYGESVQAIFFDTDEHNMCAATRKCDYENQNYLTATL